MKLREAVEKFEKGRLVIPNMTAAWLDDGNGWRGEFVTVCSGGIKKQGAHSALYPTEDVAVDAWLEAAEKYASHAGGRFLYWRARPSAVDRVLVTVAGATDAKELYSVFSRLLTTDHVWPTLSPSTVRLNQSREIVVANDEKEFRISYEQQADNLGPMMCEAGIRHMWFERTRR